MDELKDSKEINLFVDNYMVEEMKNEKKNSQSIQNFIKESIFHYVIYKKLKKKRGSKLTQDLMEKIQDYLYDTMEPKKGILPNKWINDLEDEIKDKFGINREIIKEAFEKLIKSNLLVRDYQDSVYYEYSLHKKLKNLRIKQ